MVNGVSTRKASNITKELWGTGFFKATVSDLCMKLDQVLNARDNRALREMQNLDLPHNAFELLTYFYDSSCKFLFHNHYKCTDCNKYTPYDCFRSGHFMKHYKSKYHRNNNTKFVYGGNF